MARSSRGQGAAFIALGIIFIAIGASGRRAFTVLGVVFLVLGLIRTRRG